MLSRKKTRTELSKPGEVQGKYVKKETSPLLRSECQGARGEGGGSGFVRFLWKISKQEFEVLAVGVWREKEWNCEVL